MSSSIDSFDLPRRLKGISHWKRRAIVAGVLLVAALIVFLMTWNAFFVYVPPGQASGRSSTRKERRCNPEPGAWPKRGTRASSATSRARVGTSSCPSCTRRRLEDEHRHPAGQDRHRDCPRRQRRLPPGRSWPSPASKGSSAKCRAARHVPHQPSRLRSRAGRRHGHQARLCRRHAPAAGPRKQGTLRRSIPTERGILKEVLQPGLYYINTKEFEVIRRRSRHLSDHVLLRRRPGTKHGHHVHLQGRLSDQHGLHGRVGDSAAGHAAAGGRVRHRGRPSSET